MQTAVSVSLTDADTAHNNSFNCLINKIQNLIINKVGQVLAEQFVAVALYPDLLPARYTLGRIAIDFAVICQRLRGILWMNKHESQTQMHNCYRVPRFGQNHFGEKTRAMPVVAGD